MRYRQDSEGVSPVRFLCSDVHILAVTCTNIPMKLMACFVCDRVRERDLKNEKISF